MSFICASEGALGTLRGGRPGFIGEICNGGSSGAPATPSIYGELDYADPNGTHYDVLGQSNGMTNLVRITVASSLVPVPVVGFDNGGANDCTLRYLSPEVVARWFQCSLCLSAFPDGVNDDIVIALTVDGVLQSRFRSFWSGQTRNAVSALVGFIELQPNAEVQVVFGNMSSAVRGITVTSVQLAIHAL